MSKILEQQLAAYEAYQLETWTDGCTCRHHFAYINGQHAIIKPTTTKTKCPIHSQESNNE